MRLRGWGLAEVPKEKPSLETNREEMDGRSSVTTSHSGPPFAVVPATHVDAVALNANPPGLPTFLSGHRPPWIAHFSELSSSPVFNAKCPSRQSWTRQPWHMRERAHICPGPWAGREARGPWTGGEAISGAHKCIVVKGTPGLSEIVVSMCLVPDAMDWEERE
eukprot:566197-Pelagomonas_calceolata.AAC.4